MTDTIRPGPYRDWTLAVRAVGGTATAWPFSTGLYGNLFGRPAAKYSAQQYVTLGNAQRLPDMTQPTEASSSNKFIFVLASKDVAADAPPTMNAFQKAKAEAFAIGDLAATKVGLPSLNDIENWLKSAGEDILILAAIGGLAWYLINRRD